MFMGNPSLKCKCRILDKILKAFEVDSAHAQNSLYVSAQMSALKQEVPDSQTGSVPEACL